MHREKKDEALILSLGTKSVVTGEHYVQQRCGNAFEVVVPGRSLWSFIEVPEKSHSL